MNCCTYFVVKVVICPRSTSTCLQPSCIFLRSNPPTCRPSKNYNQLTARRKAFACAALFSFRRDGELVAPAGHRTNRSLMTILPKPRVDRPRLRGNNEVGSYLAIYIKEGTERQILSEGRV